ncbi:MAG: hypothetical protein HRT35_26995 [Algicola sp.]|nr:hypothetical protein [Algicola sp.]
MSDQDNTPKGQRPEYLAFNVKDTPQGKAIFQQVGAAWPHKDGQGFDLQLDSIPVNGRVTLRELREERLQPYQEQQQSSPEQAQSQQRTDDFNRGRAR